VTEGRAAQASIGGIVLLERAINYTLGSLHLVTPEALSYPTPCRRWDLRALLAHLDDSLLMLTEAVRGGRIDHLGAEHTAVGYTAVGYTAADPVGSPRNRACALLGAFAAAGDHHTVSIAGYALTTGIVTSAGAIEVAIHGWDVARACGRRHPIPSSLAEEMLELAPLFVTDADRAGRFAPPVDVPPLAGPADRLVAFFGRHPYRAPAPA
jgi:uncharacterized protein (TIGR03086 family)